MVQKWIIKEWCYCLKAWKRLGLVRGEKFIKVKTCRLIHTCPPPDFLVRIPERTGFSVFHFHRSFQFFTYITGFLTILIYLNYKEYKDICLKARFDSDLFATKIIWWLRRLILIQKDNGSNPRGNRFLFSIFIDLFNYCRYRRNVNLFKFKDWRKDLFT